MERWLAQREKEGKKGRKENRLVLGEVGGHGKSFGLCVFVGLFFLCVYV